MLDLLGLDALKWLLAGVVGAVAAVWGLIIKARRDGRQDAKNEGLQDAADRLEKGREAVRDGRGNSPADRLRANDGHWKR